MKRISDIEYSLFTKLKKIVLHASPERFEGMYFICGESGEKDSDGLPENLLICPAYGLDNPVGYVKFREVYEE